MTFLIFMRIISKIVSTVANIATLVSYPTLLIAKITIRAALIFTDSNVLLTFNKKQRTIGKSSILLNVGYRFIT